jgi:alpha-D-ribose 1-methylphosphonate 5-triphosphate diphosphatase PhnM
VDKISGTKEFLRLIASGNTHGLSRKEVQTKLEQFQSQDYLRVISILDHFPSECLLPS